MVELEHFDAEGLDRVWFRFGDRDTDLPPYPSTTLRQVHGAGVVLVDDPGTRSGRDGDALVTATPGAALCVRTADCAPVVLAGRHSADGDPIVAAVHAGWRGLYEGVVEQAVRAMRRLGAEHVVWRLGPCISPAAYEFSPADLTTVALRFGPEVIAATADGAPALDLRAAVRAAVAAAGVAADDGAPAPACTATELDASGEPRYFSWRARRDEGRQVSAIWIEP